MEKSSSRTSLPIKGIDEVVVETKQYIEDRMSGKEKSLKTGSHKLNSHLMNGFDWGRIITVAGLSGSGKSTIVGQWIKEFIEYNPTEQFEILKFQFEMLGVDEVARELSARLSRSIKTIYSADGTLSDEDLSLAKIHLQEIKKSPVSIVDNIGTVKEIRDTILYYVSTRQLIEKNVGLIVTLDHSLLVKAEDNDTEKMTLDKLMHTLVGVKKYLASKGMKVMFFVLSQLNRDIETVDRVNNPKLHYPTKNDLYGASSVYYSSDYVLILHRPVLIEGIGNWYGPSRGSKYPEGLPVMNPKNGDQPMVYLHIIKERFGDNKIIPMLDELKVGKIVETNME